MKLGSSWLCFALVTSCAPVAPIKAPVVAPLGAAAMAVPGAIETVKGAEADKLSKVAASAEAIAVLNGGQPAGPRTEGVAAEADLIRRVAGPAAEADRMAALERAAAKAEGRAEEAVKLYALASTEADMAKAKAAAAERALASAVRSAAVEQEAQRARLQQELDRITAEANARVNAANEAWRAWQRKLITLLTFGLGVALITGGIVVQITAASIPMFGPKAAMALIISGGALVALGVVITQIQNFLEEHPWVTGAFLGLGALSAVVAGALMYANHKHRPVPV